MNDDGLPELSERASYYLNPQSSDLALVTDVQGFPAHRFIVCRQSRFLSRAANQKHTPYPMEGATKPIYLRHTAPYLLTKVLEYLYKGDYTFTTSTILTAIDKGLLRDNSAVVPTPDTNPPTAAGKDALAHRYVACFHAKMYAQAEYFLIEGLQTLAAHRFSTALWALRQDEDGFAAAMAELYDRRSWNYVRLHQRIVSELLHNQAIYRAGPGLKGKGLTPQLLEHVPCLGRDLAFVAMDEVMRLRRRLGAAEQALKAVLEEDDEDLREKKARSSG
ncbi:BTB/POZ domain-containing protein [Aspergillus homomorphus CBS 101889]|uniref:BTB domain-containing protein n=1 Tax=Aspergillus homomorphus (strain CBS 101889) TaxID=1450537 RepID=A0A395HPJ0_ASPHC|nr:hypothetical protein BO97DRAFT_417446 [Aspergillus homomorphus CBS 101889]RAL08778.1 hypothetical protein BO97DRAFT_417446 [Aspergillus homomorphus CBS 101889]